MSLFAQKSQPQTVKHCHILKQPRTPPGTRAEGWAPPAEQTLRVTLAEGVAKVCLLGRGTCT